jgi:hypothetical protein
VFKKVGILHPEPHMAMLYEAGGIAENADKVDY